MIKAAICDDDIAFSCRLEEMLLKAAKKLGVPLDIQVFGDGDTLLKAIGIRDRFDLIFLDIEMERINGIFAARKIRETDRTVLLIYISGYEQYLKELFEVEPFRFLSKPIDEALLNRYFREACERIGEKAELFEYTCRKSVYRAAVRDIVYFESKYRVIYIFFRDGSQAAFYGRLNRIEEDFETKKLRFLRPHQSFFVNYDYVKAIGGSAIILYRQGQDITLPISSDRKKQMKEQVFRLGAGETQV